MVRWVVLSLLSAVCSAEYTSLKETAPGCQSSDDHLECNVTNCTEGVKFDTDDWSGKKTKNITVTGAKALHLISQRGVERIVWYFVDCSDVRVDDPGSDPLAHLRVTNSKVTSITRVAGVLKGTGSVFEKVNIDSIHQFDFHQSQISRLAIRATQKKSTIIESEVEVVDFLEVEGQFLFEITQSNITEIKKFIFNTTDNDSRIVGTNIGTIGREGFVVSGNKLLLEDVKITTLAPRAFLVRSNLVLRNSQIQHAESDSFVLENGSIDLENVMIGDKNVSFSIDKASGGLLVLALILPQSSNATGIAVGIPLSLLFGILCGAGLAYLILRRRMQGQDRSQDNMELLPSTDPVPALPSNPPPPTPTPQHQTLQEEKDLSDDEIYEEYDEVTNQAPAPPKSVNLLPGSHLLKPSNHLSPPAGAHSNGGPPAPSLAAPRPAPPELPRRESPSPQPPSREGAPLPNKPPPPARQPPVSENKPQLPKPQLPKPISKPEETSSAGDCELEIYDEVSEQYVPAPPPTAQRPPIPGGKPSFLHRGNEAQTSPRSPPGVDPEKSRFVLPGLPKGRVDPPGPKPPGNAVGPPAPLARPWGKPRTPQWPPVTPSKPPPPPSELKPSSGSVSVEDDDEAIYETVPE